ncbi:MAG TPA: 4-hydroxythreonine-4-phosphate dehydrogenase PdxA [Pseudomonadales bacterium]|nr:4-hydroxythreonine-4-phosphate dehydrogenase PdxA [Pseudomonadales bacterium]
MKNKPAFGLTMGDPAGIGPEICLRAMHDATVLKSCVPVLFGDASVLERLKSSPAFSSKSNGHVCRVVSAAEFDNISEITHPLIVDCEVIDAKKIQPVKISAAAGRAAYIYTEQAIAAALAGKTLGVITGPVHKEALNLAGVKFPGQTEIFTALTGAKRSCMMLYSDKLTVSMATTHIGYHEVPQKISVERLLNVIELTANAMRRMLQREPHLGICGLNPHAGEHGLFGNHEEEKFVEPAVAGARRKGIDISGPLVPDAAFTLNVRKKFDAIVTLYHDQGHIPFKMLAFDTGVNVTLGLPIIRTSVDHGTAFDIAWQGKADPTSLFSAIQLAVRLSQERSRNFKTPAGRRTKRKSKVLNPV